MMTGYEGLLILLAAGGLARGTTGTAEVSNPEPAIGESFFLPSKDIRARLLGGLNIFKKIKPECFHTKHKNSLTKQSESYFEDNEAFYRAVATDSGIAANLKGAYTMGETLAVKTGSTRRGQEEVKGTSLNIWTRVSTTYLDEDCYKREDAELKDELITDLESLPTEVGNPQFEMSWNQHQTFLQKYGSHFVTQVKYGASISQWTFARKTHSYSKQDLLVRACADFEGPTKVGKLSVQACSGVTQDEARRAKSFEMSSSLELRGGTDETRNSLRAGRTEERIDQLLNEGRKLHTPVNYKFESIWDILKMKFYNRPSLFAKALSLQQYYEGYKNFGCTLIQMGDLDLRRFQLSPASTKDIPVYECVLEKEGCHSDYDCHVSWFHGYCHGSTCVNYSRERFGGFSGHARGRKALDITIRRHQEGESEEGANVSCYPKGLGAACLHTWSANKVIWGGLDSHATIVSRSSL